MRRTQIATSKVENSVQVSSCRLKFVHRYLLHFCPSKTGQAACWVSWSTCASDLVSMLQNFLIISLGKEVRVFVQRILKGEVSLYHWPPAWLVWNQLYDKWQFLFLFAKQTIPNHPNRRSTVQWYFPLKYSLVCPWNVLLAWLSPDKTKGNICKTFNDNLMIIVKAGCVKYYRLTLNVMVTYGIWHSFKKWL